MSRSVEQAEEQVNRRTVASARLGLHIPIWSAVQFFDSDRPDLSMTEDGLLKRDYAPWSKVILNSCLFGSGVLLCLDLNMKRTTEIGLGQATIVFSLLSLGRLGSKNLLCWTQDIPIPKAMDFISQITNRNQI